MAVRLERALVESWTGLDAQGRVSKVDDTSIFDGTLDITIQLDSLPFCFDESPLYCTTT